MVVIYILLAVIIVLIVVVAVMVKTSQGRRDDISQVIKAESSRLEGVLRDENKSSRLESGEVFSRF